MRREDERLERYRYVRRRRGPLNRFFTLVLGVVIGCLAYAHIVGFPEWLVDVIRERTGDSGFTFKAAHVRLDLLRGIVLHDAELYRRGVVGASAAEAERIVARLDLSALLRRESIVQSIIIENGSVRPLMLLQPERVRRDREREDRWSSTFDSIIRLEFVDCEVSGVSIDRAVCRVEWRGQQLVFKEIRGTVSRDGLRGEMGGSVSYDTHGGMLDVHAETSFDPHLMLPILEYVNMHGTARILRRFDFGDAPPQCEFDLQAACRGEPMVMLDGSFWFKDAAYRGVGLLRGDGRLRIDYSPSNTLVVVDPVFLVRPEGMGQGGFSLDTRRREVVFHGQTSFHPEAVSRMINVLTNPVARCRFDGPVRIDGEGVASTVGDWDAMKFRANVSGHRMGISNFVADTCSFALETMGPTITVSNVEASLDGGRMRGSVELVVPTGGLSNMRYRVSGQLEEADFDLLAHKLTSRRDAEFEGSVSCAVDVSGWMGEGNANTAAGTGMIGVQNGRVFLLPIFGGLSSYMTKIIPGLDFVLKQSDARADLVIQKGKVRSEEISIKGDVLSLSGKGAYDLDGSLDFDVQIRLLKSHTLGGRLLKPLFYPISKLFEFRLRGTSASPEWYLTNFSSDVLEKLGLKKKEGADAMTPLPTP